MTDKEILARVDHTLLKADAKKRDIERICKEALEYHTASICINPCYIEYAVGILGDKIPVCTVIGFPLGAMTTEAKVFEAKDAVEKGAKEFEATVIGTDGSSRKLMLALKDVTEAEKEVLLAGSLINFYKNTK